MSLIKNNNRPIGVFDSGVGGLTVLRALRTALPHENFIYLGDTARVPYGNKGAPTIQRYTLEAAQYLLQQDIKLLVLACNTVTAEAISTLQEQFRNLPIIGVIEPGAAAAVQSSVKGQIGVLSTRATLQSQAYPRTIHSFSPSAEVFSYAAPLLVPLAEEGWLSGAITTSTIQQYLEPVLKHSIDCLLLGCTHYPLFLPLIRQLLPDTIHLVDSATTTAQSTSERLQQLGLENGSTTSGTMQFYVTDDPKNFSRIGELFLGEQIIPETVQLTELQTK